ncbi:phosphoribosylformylglycinamidine synthase isoform X2 [Protopterus annectens]|uniref:phosphoribosylformylglycinamidine synthase isoform X2 n=1 Tax=Protopterus annectens TaxID=7888 RepID=UPI001CFBF08B|nr:phosphoribosylformylglycinamidine synthase isoform X2 [Protopterus annectens]
MYVSFKMVVLHFFQRPTTPSATLYSHIQSGSCKPGVISSIVVEICYNVNWSGPDQPNSDEIQRLQWLFSSPFDLKGISSTSFLSPADGELLVEIGPRLNFSTASSTNAVSICRSIGMNLVDRVERSKRYLIKFADPSTLSSEKEKIVTSLYDRMTECCYQQPIESFDVAVLPENVYEVDILSGGKSALEKANKELGLAFDDWDLNYYTSLFQKVQRNPTSVECFDLAQSNSEHSRHWFFKGHLKVDGKEVPCSLFDMIMRTQETSSSNNVIKFCDNSSAIEGREVSCLYPADPAEVSPFERRTSKRHVIFTAETHNFPTGVAPFSGATTGTGGRIRDVQCTGRGAHVVAGSAGYCFGNLMIPGHQQPWEGSSFLYPGNFASPLEVAVEASNGASDYGNKFGEPVLTGFARSFGMRLPSGERREWIKPIMFSGGIGTIEDQHIRKEEAKAGMEVVKIGGPVYRIGVGGGAASSIQVQGDNASELDFGAVQRGDAEMEQKMNRALRACVESCEKNPICSIHDQGAGGNGNVLKELSEPAGAVIYAKNFKLGDPTLSVLEIWGAEYQESNALLLQPHDAAFLRRVCEREKCPVDFVGKITGDGKIVLVDDRVKSACEDSSTACNGVQASSHPVDLELEWVLGKMPRKEFTLERITPTLQPLLLPSDLCVRDALDRVLRLPSVASKRYLTNKVDRSVTGLVAQQQCVGPLHTPLADVAVIALSYFDKVGAATAIGEQPIKGLIDPGAGARMAVGEALTNLMFAEVTDLKDVKCSGNWMWPAKLPGEGNALYEACVAMCSVMRELHIAVDGGKDSLSMAARVGAETVKAPGALVISVYAVCPDITATITPDLKNPSGKGVLLHLPISAGRYRLGGSALAQCFSQIGDCSPDLDNPSILASCFEVTQRLLQERILSSGHDISDGGLITCLLEMAFAGNRGIDVDLSTQGSVLEVLFAEELGLVLEVPDSAVERVRKEYQNADVQCMQIGYTVGEGPESMVRVRINGQEVLNEKMSDLRGVWEFTSFRLEEFQANPLCIAEEEQGLALRTGAQFKLTFDPTVGFKVPQELGHSAPRVAVVREEGSNGDREMAASLLMAGFEVWDVTMWDICTGAVTLDTFRGLAFVGGFSYADVLGSAKGWAASVIYNPTARAQFEVFRTRSDTFSLGVCNGCQLMALLGWVGSEPEKTASNEAVIRQGVLLNHNKSGRYESRFVSVSILESPSIMLRGMTGSTLGVWVAHGEGYMQFRSEEVLTFLKDNNLMPLRYVDDHGLPTEQYPLNPNGSPLGVAGLCSSNGRHLAMMPHPERTTLTWQWPWMPLEWRQTLTTSPWLRMFQNAFEWCCQN